MGPLEFQTERWRRIRVRQKGDEYLSEPKRFLKGDFDRFSPRRLRKIATHAELFVLDGRDILYRLAQSTKERHLDMESELRLATYYIFAHEDYHGRHQGIKRTHKKLRTEFYWPNMYADVERCGRMCRLCKLKGTTSPSPGNIESVYPFEVLSMDFVTHLPQSEQGNTFLLLFQVIFSGFVMCKPMGSTTAQEVTEAYEETVFRRFEASSLLRHNQNPRFMSEVFTRFRELLGSRQRATLGCRPQAKVSTIDLSRRTWVGRKEYDLGYVGPETDQPLRTAAFE
ncbi:reverse transcriptase [Phytophthora megakarya]|uniref:Reverse transcriptase n=1 Tax=Phytophthora megakarya TaxID=4795 RepID=A0A225VXF4_9STRA|nr:reverse transcriptase [Phytophthora megakarya]